MKENEKNNTGIPIEPITTVEAGCGIPVSNKRKASLEGLEIFQALTERIGPMHGNKEWKAYYF